MTSALAATAAAAVSAPAPFDSLDQETFRHTLCSLLSLAEKQTAFTHLSHSTKSKLASSAYRHDKLVLRTTAQSGTAAAKTAGRLPLVPCVGSLTCHLSPVFDASNEQHIAITDAIVEALRGTNLKSLEIQESFLATDSPLTIILDAIAAAPRNHSLETLTIRGFAQRPPARHQLSDDEQAARVERVYTHLHWSALGKLDALHTLDFSYQEKSHPARELMIVAIAENLPVSVKSLYLSPDLSEPQVVAWLQALSNPRFVPLLELLEIASDLENVWRGRAIEVLANTIIEGTNTTRPVRTLRLRIDAPQVPLLAKLNELESLHLLCSRGSLTVIPYLPAASMSKLVSFTVLIDGTDGSDDLPAVLEFLHHRRATLTSFAFEATETETVCWSPMSERAINNLASLRQLRILSLTGSTGAPVQLAQDGALASLTPSCLPHLEEIKLSSIDISDATLLTLLRAAPSVTTMDIQYCGADRDVASLVKIGANCPLLQTLAIVGPLKPMSYDSFQTFRQDADGLHSLFPHLTTLRLFCRDAATLHLLFASLKSAPLRYFYVNPIPWTTFPVYLQSRLPHLRAVRSTRDSAVQRLYERKEVHTGRYEFIEHDRSSKKSTGQFRLDAVDREGRDGRAAFFHALYAELSAEEQRGLARWDAGDYSWQPLQLRLQSSMLSSMLTPSQRSQPNS